ncbi:hypothetical protein F5878DRAFT_670019 [Lentinula raphanica]|uniref:Uncharacterized protein n=1 Tax=Lentinula raphanica TaxID=153919 RepID=A0AA38NX54_9AGAR|nr:hypothetical protein F5878DRAFT_670019 [Lentinula raphanica]
MGFGPVLANFYFLSYLSAKGRGDFDKVYAALVSFSSSTYDDSRDFGSEYKLVRKDQVLKSVPVTSESQWLRVFDAWTASLLKVYPHRKIELETYKAQIMEYFRSSPYDPSVAIRVDKEARQKAANTPFDLGNPESFHTLLLKELLSARKRPSVQNVVTHLVSSEMRRGVQSPVLITGSMATAVSVGNSTEPLTTNPAMTSSRSVEERVESALQGPKSLAGTKQTLDSTQSASNPRFRRGYLWSSSSSSCNIIPPSITSTMTAPPLPSPPEHLLNNPQILATLQSMSSYIKVETPFNVDCLELLLSSHPN